MKKEKFKDYLIRIEACGWDCPKDKTTAIGWVGNKTRQQAWKTCKRGDWMMWLIWKENKTPIKIIVELADEFAARAARAASDAARAARAARAASYAASYASDAAREKELRKQAKLIRKYIPKI